MRWFALVVLLGCGPQPGTPALSMPAAPPPPDEAAAPIDLRTAGVVVDRLTDFAFDGGRIELEMRRDGNRIIEVAYNHYAVPVVMAWQLADLVNLDPTDNTGVAVLPAAPRPNAQGAGVVVTTLAVIDPTQAYRRVFQLHVRFGDPQARPSAYAYRLPYAAGKTFAVLQGFHGAFSHRGSNEFAVDFDCPVATKVLAARPGIIVASNAAAQGAGTSPDYLEYARTNFVLVLHDDGTLGEYMHLAPSGVEVSPGEHVARGQEIALSGNTGFSSTPHLHFQVMTAADDGIAARSFPIRFSVAPRRVEEPVQGRAYPGWE